MREAIRETIGEDLATGDCVEGDVLELGRIGQRYVL